MTTETAIASRLHDIISAIRIHSADSFEIADKRIEIDPLRPVTANSRDYLRCPLTHELTGVIYRQFYARQWNGCFFEEFPDDHEEASRNEDSANLVKRLNEANSVGADWDQHWTVTALTDAGGTIAEKGARIRHFQPGQFLQQEQSNGVSINSLVDAKVYQGAITLQPGFYYAYSPEKPPHLLNQNSIRFYWNCSQPGAVQLVRLISSTFPRYAIPYEMKCPALAHGYWRRDSFVLYLSPTYLPAAFYHLRMIHAKLESELSDAPPLFTRRLGSGLGAAETPRGGLSFGQHRCALVSKGLVEAFKTGTENADERQEHVHRQFQKAGLSLERPWRSSAESDPFGIDELSL